MSGLGPPPGIGGFIVRPNAMQAMPQQAFDSLIAAYGVRLTWAKSHICPCVGAGQDVTGYGIPGGANPGCQTCVGLGVYWDPFITPFIGLITFGSFLPIPTEPGVRMNEKWGQIANGTPLITIPQSSQPTVWETMSTWDQVVEIDTPGRYNTQLIKGVQENLPIVNGLSVASTGAATIWDEATQTSVSAGGYTVSGNTVTLQDDTISDNTIYVVEFTADLTFVLLRRSGALPHRRPFGGGQQALPTRFNAENLDLWLRTRNPVGQPPKWSTTTGGASYPIAQPGTITTAGTVG